VARQNTQWPVRANRLINKEERLDGWERNDGWEMNQLEMNCLSFPLLSSPTWWGRNTPSPLVGRAGVGMGSEVKKAQLARFIRFGSKKALKRFHHPDSCCPTDPAETGTRRGRKQRQGRLARALVLVYCLGAV
jgi:hypothetical protein